jgi:hypothetical protein
LFKKTLFYSLSNGGDGSVSMSLVESAKLATWLQENDICDEGWAEDCSGTIVLESESPITCKESIETIEDTIEQYEDCGDDKKIKELHQMRDDLDREKRNA